MVNSMRNSSRKKKRCRREKDLLTQCVLCRKYMSPAAYGFLFERVIKQKLSITKPPNNTSGDGQKYGKNIEIKTSLSSKDGQLNFVQIRPDHTLDYYIVLIYNMFEGNVGKIHFMVIPADTLHSWILPYGSYAHRTKDVLGEITAESIVGNHYEYALRPNPRKSKTTKAGKLWLEFLKYEVPCERKKEFEQLNAYFTKECHTKKYKNVRLHVVPRNT